MIDSLALPTEQQELVDLGPPTFRGADRLDVHLVSAETAARWMARYHYTGTAPLPSRFWGVFDGDLIAVVIVGPGVGAGLAQRYGLELLRGGHEIRRVAVHPDAPRFTASRVLSIICREEAREGNAWLVSYADTGRDHHGGIYQALNALYLGLTKPAAVGYFLNGVRIHSRLLHDKLGTVDATEATRRAKTMGWELTRVAGIETAKHTYLLPVARDRALRQLIRETLAPYTQPYPKRAAAASSDAPGFQLGEDGSQLILPLHFADS